jgi:hypothetical protein
MDKQMKLQDGVGGAIVGKSRIFKLFVYGGGYRSWDN